MRKKVLGKLSSLSVSLFGEKTEALNADIARLTALIATRRAELKQAGTDSITDSYKAFSDAKALTAPSSAGGTPKSAAKKARDSEARFARMRSELAEVQEKLVLMNAEVSDSIDKEINARAMAISETVTVVQEAVTRIMQNN
jgi:hypothetical protein